MVQVVAVLTSIAFVGVIFVVLFAIVLGGGSGGGGHGDLVGPAEDRVEAQPNNPAAWDALAAAFVAEGELDEALPAAEMAAELAPGNINRLSTVIQIQLQTGDVDGAVASVESFTAKNPRNAEGFLLLGRLAAQVGQTAKARLAYQTFLRLAPDDQNAAAVRQAIQQLDSGGGGSPAPAPQPAPQHGGG